MFVLPDLFFFSVRLLTLLDKHKQIRRRQNSHTQFSGAESITDKWIVFITGGISCKRRVLCAQPTKL